MAVVTDAISCDPAVMSAELEAPVDPRSPATWLGRRAYSFGASEAHALLVICGKRSADTCPRWMLDELVKETRTRFGAVPMLLARKAGLRRAQTQKRIMQIGTRREVEVLDHFRREQAHLYDLDADSIKHAFDVPDEWMPLIDRQCPQLASTPDAWGREIYEGLLIVIEVKCSYEPYAQRYGRCPPYYETQVQARMGAELGARGLLIEGEAWSNERVPDGPVTPWKIDRDDAVIDEVRACARELWPQVEALRAQKEEQ